MTDLIEIQHFPLVDLAATDRLAHLLKPLVSVGDFLACAGPLGVGKTAFARALIRAFAAAPNLDVPSPTFSITQQYDAEDGTPFPILHADLYRLDEGSDVSDLGLADARDQGLLIVEWPDRLPASLLAGCLLCRFLQDASGQRSIVFYGDGRWQSRLSGLGAA